MNERDDYLFERSGEPDPEIAALERLLAPLRHDGRALPARLPATVRPDRRRMPPWLAAAALALLGALALWWLRGEAPFAPGEAPRTIVAGDAVRRVALGEVAALDLAAGGELRFESWRDDAIRVQLARGAVEVRVAAAGKGTPAVRVATRAGEVEPDGPDACAFRLTLASGGQQGTLAVQEGVARFAAPKRTALVPAGASVRFTEDGPGYPVYDDCSAVLRQVVRFAEEAAEKRGPGADEGLAKKFVDVCRTPHDTLVLWHLLAEGDIARSAGVEQRLLELAGPPEPVGKTKQPSWSADAWLVHLRATAWR